MLPLSSAQSLILAQTRRYAHVSLGSVFKTAPEWTEGQITTDKIRLKQVQGARFLPQTFGEDSQHWILLLLLLH